MVCQLWYCRTDCLNTLQMYTENAKQLAFCVTIWHSSELCYKEKEIYTTWRTMSAANHCRFSSMSGALLWWGEEYWLKLVLEESRDAKFCVSRFYLRVWYWCFWWIGFAMGCSWDARFCVSTRLAHCDLRMRNVDWNCWWKKVETQNLASHGLLVCLILSLFMFISKYRNRFGFK